MDELTAFERRLATALETHAGPRRTVAAVEIAQAAASRAPITRWTTLRVPWRLVGVIALLIVPLAAGAAFVGSQQRQVLTERELVEPFIGLPPEGAPPSTPESGQLVLSVYGRLNLDKDVHGIWVFADGRLIWRRSLEQCVVPEGCQRGFGAAEPTRAVIEQRLTPEGVELLRSEAISFGLSGLGQVGENECGGPVYWAHVAVRIGDELMRGGCSDPELAARLADHAYWLPASAWADQRIGGYVPSWYAVCVWSSVDQASPSRIEELLPPPTKNLLRSEGILMPDVDRPHYEGEGPVSCYRVTTEDARATGRTLDDAGLQRRSVERRYLVYEIADDQVPAQAGIVDFYPFLPDGDTVEYGQ